MVFHRKKARIHDIFIGIIIMKILWKAMKSHWWKFHRVFITYWRYQYFMGISLDYISWLNKDVFMAKPPCEMLTFPGVQGHESIMQCVWKQSWQIFIRTCLVVHTSDSSHLLVAHAITKVCIPRHSFSALQVAHGLLSLHSYKVGIARWV